MKIMNSACFFCLTSEKHNHNVTIVGNEPVKIVPSPFSRLAIVHITIVLFLVGVLLASTCLGAQYIHRYRKYQLAAATEDVETITDCSSKIMFINMYYLLFN